MNGTKYLPDTNLILYILSGDETLANHLHPKSLYASFISEIEFFGYKGLTAKEEKSVSAFLAQFRINNIDEAIKREAIALRKEYGLKLPDCLLAATAVSLQLTLITADRQFRQVERLNLELYEV